MFTIIIFLFIIFVTIDGVMQADSISRKLIRMQLEMEEPLKSVVHKSF